MKIEVKRYEGPWPEGARFLEPGDEVLLATGAIGAGPFTGVVEGLEKVALGSLLGTMGKLVTIPVDGDSMSGAGILDGEMLKIELADPSRPGVIRPADENTEDEVLMLLMPMRIED